MIRCHDQLILSTVIVESGGTHLFITNLQFDPKEPLHLPAPPPCTRKFILNYILYLKISQEFCILLYNVSMLV